MHRYRLGFGWRHSGAAALLALAGCGDPAPQKSQPAADSGVTVELPDPVAEPVTPIPSAEPAEADESGPASVEAPATAAAAEEDAEETKKKPPPAPDPQPAPSAEAPPAVEAEAAAPSSSGPDRPPLPNAVIARTLDRIGFRCGSVTSTSRIESSDDPSAYKISCSSGRTYRASAKSGRFRFRELSGGE
jgi:outer membrane biosynthesis protein TonB